MKSMWESQISHLCVDSILSWIGTDGQCLAALHTHISALEPDQLTQPCQGKNILDYGSVRVFLFTRKAPTFPNLRVWLMIIDHTLKGDWSTLISAQWRCGVKGSAKRWSGRESHNEKLRYVKHTSNVMEVYGHWTPQCLEKLLSESLP